MELCNGGRRCDHDRIVIEGDCPACAAIEEKEDLEKQLKEKEDELIQKDEEISSLEARISELENQE